MKTSIFNLVILDESGSMDCIRRETISGCNEILNTIRMAQREHTDTQQHYVSIYAFQSGAAPSHYIVQNAKPEEVKPVTEQDYIPCGCTPLYDAIGMTVKSLREIVKTHDMAIGSVTIITDGMENSSEEYSHSQIVHLIDELKEKGWNFNFIGANIDVEAVSRDLNIDNCLAFEQTAMGSYSMFSMENKSRKRWFDRVDSKMSRMAEEGIDDKETFEKEMRESSEGYFEEFWK